MRQRKVQPLDAEMKDVFAIMGLTLSILHEIEEDFSRAFLFGLSERYRKKGKNYDDFWEDRDHMTFGRMVSIMKEKWELDPVLELFLDIFVKERNIFVHKLTKMDGYGLFGKRERKKLAKRVDLFFQLALTAKKIFSSALDATMCFGKYYLGKYKKIDIDLQFPEEIMQEVSGFMSLLKPRESDKPVKPTKN
jgi:hypothetical protein